MPSCSKLADLFCRNVADHGMILFEGSGEVVSFNHAARTPWWLGWVNGD